MEGIKKSSDFKKVYRSRNLRADGLLVLYKLENHLAFNRVGISVSKRVGNSVVRHRLKRQLREIVRLNNPCLRQGFDLVMVVRPGARGMVYHDLEKSFFRLVKRHRLVDE